MLEVSNAGPTIAIRERENAKVLVLSPRERGRWVDLADGEQWVLDPLHTIAAIPHNDITHLLTAPCHIKRRGDEFVLVDHAGPERTTLNCEPIASGDHIRLTTGDVVGVGARYFVFQGRDA